MRNFFNNGECRVGAIVALVTTALIMLLIMTLVTIEPAIANY